MNREEEDVHGLFSQEYFTRTFLKILKIRKRGHNYIVEKKSKREGMFAMAEEDESKSGEEKPEELTTSKPGDQIYQKLHLCDYLRELYEAAEKENEPPIEKKEGLPTPHQ